jgi:quinohemoprotein ethanol dehydrogenase
VDAKRPYTITGAPRLVKDMVVIGNGGADYGVRGYVTAYEQKTGKLRWRFFTVPGSAEGPFEHPELEAAAKTWDPASPWETGVGGTVWDSMSFDPELNLLYVGTGNGSPWARFLRSPSGGDNLYLSSILAIDPDDGRLVWHYQTTPADSWDYTATQHIILADIPWQGATRKVLFQAPKNGFFYVLDRKTGELLAADKYVRVTWASHVDLATGRPVETATADYSREDRVIFPSTLGGHNWHPMAFNARTGLVYIPAQEAATHFSPTKFTVLLGGAASPVAEEVVPDDFIGNSVLLGWDPIARTVRWSYPRPMFANAGVLSTDGGLVVQGDGEGYINFHDATNGTLLRRIETGTGIIAPPVSYAIEGRQYIAVLAGWGGALFGHAERQSAARRYSNAGRVIVLTLDGAPVPLPPATPPVTPRAEGDRLRVLDEQAQRGRAVYIANCGACHSWFGHNGLLPDLRRTAPAIIDDLGKVLLEGAFEARGMPSFRGTLDATQVEDLKAYLRAVRLDAGVSDP